MTGAELCARRLALGLSKKKLAKLWGCHTSTVTRMENSADLERAGMVESSLMWIELFQVDGLPLSEELQVMFDRAARAAADFASKMKGSR